MKSITIHSLDNILDIKIRKIAKQQGLSLNKTIKDLLRQALGLKGVPKIDHKDEFSEFCGVWTKKDTEKFYKNTDEFNKISKRDWQ